MSNGSVQNNGVTPGRIVGAILIVLVIVFCALNSRNVQMNWIVTTSTQPLFVVIIVFSLIGLAVGYLAGRRRR